MDNQGNSQIPSHEDFIAAAVQGAPQDVSLPIIKDLFEKGYVEGHWNSNPSSLDIPCLSRNGERFQVEQFINETTHDAFFYSHTHVGCKCSVTLSGPGLPDVVVGAFGII